MAYYQNFNDENLSFETMNNYQKMGAIMLFDRPNENVIQKM
jgi:hypothetical protein